MNYLNKFPNDKSWTLILSVLESQSQNLLMLGVGTYPDVSFLDGGGEEAWPTSGDAGVWQDNM
jgi:hypothetical protein